MRGWGRFLGAALATCAALPLAPASGAASSGHPLPAYVDNLVNRFVLYANRHWDVASTGNPAPQFTGSPPAQDNGDLIPGGDTPHYIWAPTCSTGKQTVTFRRKVWLPGATQRLDFTAIPSLLGSGNQFWSAPFSSIKLLANGQVLEKMTEAGKETVTAPKLAGALKYGNNVFEVVVVKRANPSYIKACSGKHAPGRLGIQFDVDGEVFAQDLAVKPPAASEATRYFHVTPGKEVAFFSHFSVSEKGPAAAQAGQFTMMVQPGFMVMSSDADGAPYFPTPTPIYATEQSPFGACTHSSNGRTLTCPFSSWFEPGETSMINAGWKVAAPTDLPPTDVEQMTVDWTISTLTTNQDDLNTANNHAQFLAVFCYPQATSDGCDTH